MDQVISTILFIKIYNEKVRDLLATEENGSTTGNFSLRVREHPKLGPYVQDLSQHLVTDKRKLLEYLATGNRRRSTAATENNIYSSRSHAVFTIRFKQTDGENYETDKSSKVHLVDLAGSLQELSQKEDKPTERASAAQSKTRLKEGANINKSLVTLGNVISALAEVYYESTSSTKEHSNTKIWQPFVPYRDSVLTWLLKDTLGGNSNTIMIATVSPASSCLNETINTLRYAKRTKRIVNQPILNEDPKIRTIRELRDEISKLRNMLMSFQSSRKDSSSAENLSNFSRSCLEELTNSKGTTSKWLDPGGTQLTSNQDDYSRNCNFEKLVTEKRYAVRNEIPRKENTWHSSTPEGINASKAIVRKSSFSHIFRGAPRAAPSGGDACKINDEKKSDVNGSVIDNLPHETQIFSDSLESFSSLPLKTINLSDADVGELGRRNAKDYVNANRRTKRSYSVTKPCSSPKRKFKFCLKREFSSCENLAKQNLSKMLHRSRPDLIKNISTRSKDGLPSTSSQSCTDISNLSQSTSENSLNSSGSVDAQSSENRSMPSLPQKGSSIQQNKGKGSSDQVPKKDSRNESFQIALRKKDKRSEIVEAVTTRLYITKKKPDHRMEALQMAAKEDYEDDGELEELKLCKRARMKLFDLSRKLAMTRKMKKTVDSDTQTDFQSGTVRLKEKCVVTDQSGVLKFENCGTNTACDEDIKAETKPCVIMNQVFIPQSASYVVECGKGMRIEVPGIPIKHDLSTQTNDASKTYKNMNTSPIKCISQNTDCFSDDSLESEEKFELDEKKIPEDEKTHSIQSLHSIPEPLSRRSRDSLVDLERKLVEDRKAVPNDQSTVLNKAFSYERIDSRETSKAPNELQVNLFDGLPLNIFTENHSSEEIINDLAFNIPLSSNILSPGSRKDNFSSENSFTSIESTDAASSSETSSEDFVFYESPKDKELVNRIKNASDRELYTITENSEQSDPSDVISPVQSQESSLNASEVGGEMPLSPKTTIQKSFQEQIQKNQSGCQWKGSYDVSEKSEESKKPFFNNAVTTETCNSGQCFYPEPTSRQTENTSPNQFNKMCSSILQDFEPPRTVYSSKNKAQNLKVPNSVFFPAYNSLPQNIERVPNLNMMNTSKALTNDGEVQIQKSSSGEVNSGNAKAKPNNLKPRKVNWTDVQSNPEKQFLNFNILSSSKTSPFTIDTHLFEEGSKKDQSTETMFASEDSITFVFMGPAKPKTSVLMEIIRRSLNQGSSSNETSSLHRKSSNKGVQCDSTLMRSVSVDTALIALSRIAKHEQPSLYLPRTTSLNTLVPDEMQTILEQGRLHGVKESGVQCDLETEYLAMEKKINVLKYSVCTSTTRDQQTETADDRNKTTGSADKQKKSVSWFEEAKCEPGKSVDKISQANLQPKDEYERPEGSGPPYFHLSYGDSGEVENEESNEDNRSLLRYSIYPEQPLSFDTSSQTRRVRFSKPKRWSLTDICQIINRKKEAVQSAEDMPTFLKEATQLLRNLNYFSANCEMTVEEVIRKLEEVNSQQRNDKCEELIKASLKRSFKKSEVSVQTQVEGSSESALGPRLGDRKNQDSLNSTWPRRRTTGKPPTGIRFGSPRLPRSPFPSRSSSTHSNGLLDCTKNYSQFGRVGSTSTEWNISNLSTTFSNSYVGETQSRPSSSRSISSNGSKSRKDLSSNRCSPRRLSPRPNLPKLNFDSILDLEADLEQSCRRLELATEQDRIRQEALETKNSRILNERYVSENDSSTDFSEDESTLGGGIVRMAVEPAKRRKTVQCIDVCTCMSQEQQRKQRCQCHWSKIYRSTFELDTYGPGSKHCHQLCMFCRKKESELYCSTPTLNSECALGRCRLNYYGYCPCSPIRLRHVASSPRAYMQHLLTLRRHIVNTSKRRDA